MGLDNKTIVSQNETGEPAAIDQVEDRVEAEMKRLEGEAKKFVADGLQDKQLAQEGERLVEEAERDKSGKENAD
ncbi:MAG TPA: hypothetical protein VGO56_21845 [Pyrinomonadaceae bacterium]|jgi:hypothetical protein|nr:hypothetical protein [Pyrinomonadaceae bacterium]